MPQSMRSRIWTLTLISTPEERRGLQVKAATPVGVRMLRVDPGLILELKNQMAIAMVKLRSKTIAD